MSSCGAVARLQTLAQRVLVGLARGGDLISAACCTHLWTGLKTSVSRDSGACVLGLGTPHGTFSKLLYDASV